VFLACPKKADIVRDITEKERELAQTNIQYEI